MTVTTYLKIGFVAVLIYGLYKLLGAFPEQSVIGIGIILCIIIGYITLEHLVMNP